jgi:hypothetical protein
MIRATLELKRVAQRLLVYESARGKLISGEATALFRVCEKLGRLLSELVGVGGFRALLERALTLAKAEAPELTSVNVAADSSLEGLGELELSLSKSQIAKVEAALIAQLLGLLVTFIGKTLLLRLLLDAWPYASFEDWKS